MSVAILVSINSFIAIINESIREQSYLTLILVIMTPLKFLTAKPVVDVGH